jgi:hypothetical protein
MRVGVVMPVVGLVSLCVLCCLIATRCSRIGDEEIKVSTAFHVSRSSDKKPKGSSHMHPGR